MVRKVFCLSNFIVDLDYGIYKELIYNVFNILSETNTGGIKIDYYIGGFFGVYHYERREE